MDDFEHEGVKVSLGGIEYYLRFSLRAMNNIQKKYNAPITKLGDLLYDEINGMDVLIFVITQLIKDAIDLNNRKNVEKLEQVDEDYVSLCIDNYNMNTFMGSILKIFIKNMPEPDEESPNVTSV